MIYPFPVASGHFLHRVGHLYFISPLIVRNDDYFGNYWGNLLFVSVNMSSCGPMF